MTLRRKSLLSLKSIGNIDMKVTIHNQPADTSKLPYAEQMVQLLAAGPSQHIERKSGQRIALYGDPEIADIFVQFDADSVYELERDEDAAAECQCDYCRAWLQSVIDCSELFDEVGAEGHCVHDHYVISYSNFKELVRLPANGQTFKTLVEQADPDAVLVFAFKSELAGNVSAFPIAGGVDIDLWPDG